MAGWNVSTAQTVVTLVGFELQEPARGDEAIAVCDMARTLPNYLTFVGLET